MVDPTMTDALDLYRIWPDGSVQDASEQPCSWRSDNFMVIAAESEEAALSEFQRREAVAWGNRNQQT